MIPVPESGANEMADSKRATHGVLEALGAQYDETG
jgi:hypothetical protein